jgi:hypothetical protein
MFIVPLFTIAKYEHSQDASLPTNGFRKRGIYAQWNFTQRQRRMKFCHSQVNGWNWNLARLRRPKIICYPSDADFRPKTNAVIFLDMGHMLRKNM